MSEPTLNLSSWIGRRAKDVGPYADHIIHSVKHYEAHIQTQAARIERLEAALKWYKETVGECNRHGPGGDASRDALAKDMGGRAHIAMQEVKP